MATHIQTPVFTALLIATMLAFAGVYDVWAMYQNDGHGTISEVINSASKRWPLIPFVAGLIAAHLFRM